MERFGHITEWLRHRGKPAASHTWTTRWVHLFAAALLLFAAVMNGDVTGALFSPSAMNFEVYTGIAVGAVYGFLWFWIRGKGGGSRLPEDAPWWEKRLAGIVHFGLYASIAAILVTGFAMAYLAPSDVVVGVARRQIVDMTRRFSFIRETHEFASGLLGWLFGLHFCGAIWHRIIRKDGVLQSILPFRSKSTAS